MSNTKRSRGRPQGTGKNDTAVLEAVADLLHLTPAMRPTTAMKRVTLDAGPSDIRRYQVKWRQQRGALMEAAVARAQAKLESSHRSRSRRGVGTTYRGTESATMKAMRDITNSPTMKALEQMANNPTLKALEEMANNPTFQAIERMRNSPTARAMREIADSPTIRAMRRMRDQQVALARFNEQQEAIARLLRWSK